MSGDEKLTFSWNVLVCYFEDTGRRIPQCAYSTIRECTSHLSSFDFDVFTQMYNHGDSFCFYRESKEWQRKTDQSINHLEDVTDETINRLYYILYLIIQRCIAWEGGNFVNPPIPESGASFNILVSKCSSSWENFTSRRTIKSFSCIDVPCV